MCSVVPPAHSTARLSPSSHTARVCGGATRSAGGRRVLHSLTSVACPPIESETSVPGHSANARTALWISAALCRSKEASAISFESLGACVACSSSCFVARSNASPRHTSGRAARSSLLPDSKSARKSSGLCSSPINGASSCRTIGPASILRTVNKTLTPATGSPASSVRCTGAAPRYLGSSDGWILSVPNLGISRKRLGRKHP
mmetsp:Transcript_4449/g.11382  ORF Transcript_4449/g.11382 Transcript_4449/m.11382 type:complete len:203 (-) Transcript_4449:469-1077(-)